MNSDEVPTVQPPDSLEIIDDEVEIEKTLNRKTTTFATTNTTPPSNENEATHEQNKNKEKHTDTDVITLKSPFTRSKQRNDPTNYRSSNGSNHCKQWNHNTCNTPC